MIFKNIKQIYTVNKRNEKDFDKEVNFMLDRGFEIVRLFELQETSSSPAKFIAHMALYEYTRD